MAFVWRHAKVFARRSKESRYIIHVSSSNSVLMKVGSMAQRLCTRMKRNTGRISLPYSEEPAPSTIEKSVSPNVDTGNTTSSDTLSVQSSSISKMASTKSASSPAISCRGTIGKDKSLTGLISILQISIMSPCCTHLSYMVNKNRIFQCSTLSPLNRSFATFPKAVLRPMSWST